VLATLTLEQKVELLAGGDNWHTAELPGLARMRMSDGPAGVRGTSWNGPHSASFPCGTALGATFDVDIVEEVGRALGREARSKSAHVLLAPTVNLHRTPIGGRNFECMSEDPVLTARIAVAYVRGVQSERVACCIKHFVANDTEFERMTISSEIEERTLRELYLVPFETAVAPEEDGGAAVRSIMSSYNRVNGTYASENSPILRGILRDEWGFDGAVISDWFGTHSAAPALEAGLDLEMPGPPRERGATLLDAVRRGDVSEARVDESARRLLRLFEWTGVGADTGAEVTDDSTDTRAVIRRAAIAATVLLKNDAILPLGRHTSVALIGPNAERGHIQGGGSARVRAGRPVGILAELSNRGIDVVHEQGCSIDKRLPPVRGRFTAQYRSADGATATEETDRLFFMWMDDPAPGIDLKSFSATVGGTFTPQATGEWQFGLTVVGPAVLRVNGEVVADLSVSQTGDAFFGMGSPEIRGTAVLEEGVPATVEVEVAALDRAMLRGLMVGAAPPDRGDSIERAVEAATKADVAVVVVGTNDDWETEGNDRADMDLPGAQDELVRRVIAANPRTIVVVNAGSPVSMPWLEDAAAVMQVWFPGEEVGNSLCDVLLGAAEPGGRLPVTMPRRLADTPAYLSHPGEDGVARYSEGQFIGYRWYDARDIEPLFPFGHGLGYTRWRVDDASVTGSPAAGVTVRVRVTNIGERDGTTIVQCYVEPPQDGPRRPLRQLRAFRKVALEPGESRMVELQLMERDFAVWSVAEHAWVVPPGDYTVVVGDSSRSLTPAGVVSAPGARG